MVSFNYEFEMQWDGRLQMRHLPSLYLSPITNRPNMKSDLARQLKGADFASGQMKTESSH